MRLPFMPEDPRVVDSTGALELQSVPKRMLILGGTHRDGTPACTKQVSSARSPGAASWIASD